MTTQSADRPTDHVPSRPVHTVRDTCRACGGRWLEEFLSLGETALANSFLRSEQAAGDEARFPLTVHLCTDCGMVQLADVIDPEVLFRDYVYVTGTSTTIAEHNLRYAADVVELVAVGPDDLVVEVASNDGSLLRCFQEYRVRTLGIEPATNIAERARAAGVETVNRFFEPECAKDVRAQNGPARAVIGNNVLAHVDEPAELLRAARMLIESDGYVIAEVPQLREFVDRLEYDTIYHEHLSYFSVTSLMCVCEAAGLRIERIDHVPVHGGSVRMYATPVESLADHADPVRALAQFEAEDGLTSIEYFREFAADVERHREELPAFLRQLRDRGASLAAYGAPAKGNTLLQYCGIGTELLPYTVDRSPLKVGLLTPGTHIPVLPVETLLERRPDYVLILAWNFAEEIMEQQAEYVRQGGRFILPLPRPRIVA